MITLAIETATTTVAVALSGDDGPIGTVEINQGRRHAETLTPAIEFVCTHARIAVADIGAIGVDVGPGLFTGMRVGIATALAMGHALSVPVVGVCSLDLLAHPLRQTTSIIASVIDARKGEVFYAFYRGVGGDDDGAHRVTEPRVGSLDDFGADVLARGQDVIAVGDGAWRYREQLDPAITVVPLAHPSAVTLAELARPLALRNEIDGTVPDVHPMYLRAPDAQINWSRR